MATDPFTVPVARLRRTPGATQPLELLLPLDPDRLGPATAADSRVPAGASVAANLLLQSFEGGIMATGTLEVPWEGVCGRCTAAVAGRLRLAVRERFAVPPGRGEPVDEEAYPIVDDCVDLAPLVYEAIIAELPLAPLCQPDCRGLCPSCGADRNQEHCECVAPRDERWASLDVLRSIS